METAEFVSLIPSQVNEMLKKFPLMAILSGGFVRDTLEREPYKDLDIFAAERNCYGMYEWALAAGIVDEPDPNANKPDIGLLDFGIRVFGPSADGGYLFDEPKRVQLIWKYSIGDFDLACCMSRFTYQQTAPRLLTEYTDKQMLMRSNCISPKTFSRMLYLYRRGWHAEESEFLLAAQAAQCDSTSRNS